MPTRLVTLPSDVSAVDLCAITDRDGAAIVEGFATPEQVAAMNAELDPFVADAPAPDSGNALYDAFHGYRTVRLHGLCAKSTTFPPLLAAPLALAFAQHELGDACASFTLSTAELIQIGPGEPAQLLHRDDDSWVYLPAPRPQVLASTLVALSDFRRENGGTWLVPGSHRWPRDRQPQAEEIAACEMAAGSALFFRGDVLHGGGANDASDSRRGIAVSYCAGWLRPVENSFLTVPLEVVRGLPEAVQDLLGYRVHDAIERGGGVIGLYENGDPRRALRPERS